MTTSGESWKLQSSAKTRDPLVGTVLNGRFQIEDVLGSGGMSVVYKATQLRVNRHVAIKTLRLQLDTKPVYRERFQREISLLCTLGHPHIVTVYDCLIGPDEQPYVVMDYLRGRSLEQLIKERGALPVERAIRIAVQVLSALEHAHRKGVIHRDLKPGNIVLMDDETDFVKVVDFGLAKLNHDNRRLTQSGELWGSPPYMSPEQAKGTPEDERSDTYSFGAVLYEMLTGKDPYHYAISVFELIQAHVCSPVPPLKNAKPDLEIPEKLEQVVLKALEKEPVNRFQTASEMLNALVEARACMNSRDSGELLVLADALGGNRAGDSQVKIPALSALRQDETFEHSSEPLHFEAGKSLLQTTEVSNPLNAAAAGSSRAGVDPSWRAQAASPQSDAGGWLRGWKDVPQELPAERPASRRFRAAAPIVLAIGSLSVVLAYILPHLNEWSGWRQSRPSTTR